MSGPSTRLAVLCQQLEVHGTSSGSPVDVGQLQRLLDHDNHEMRDKMKDLMKHEIYVPQYDMDLRVRGQPRGCAG